MNERVSSLWELPKEITIIEQIAGEGFAAEMSFIPTETKAWLVRELVKAGCTHFQVSNFGNPRIMPQFRDCEELYRQLGRPEGVAFQAPALNMRALERVKKLKETGCGPDSVELLIATTDAFNRANVGKSTEDQWKITVPMVKVARDAGLVPGDEPFTRYFAQGVILGPDGPTAGGFVVAATVIHADLWKLGQLRPVGDTVRFREVGIEEAVELDRALDASLAPA